MRDLLALETLPPMDMPATNNVPAVRPGPKREDTLRKARLVEIASHIDEWLASPGLRTPR
ncbi:hypothetical protein CQ13_01310 [Bradyrhizobium retamae]|uniref:Uncharacterized protein n=1 Tax=Bradyrhizobium retamae TaxID=1300035 RepID=A0A0R3NDE1_9BRAD|nr:hypothetical protein CQ13_01310 [Bradyrhizobium retamae]